MISKVSEIQVKQKYKEKHSTWECVHDCLRRKKNHHRQHSLYIYKQFMCQILAIYVPYVPSRAMRCVLNEVKWWWPEKMFMEKKGGEVIRKLTTICWMDGDPRWGVGEGGGDRLSSLWPEFLAPFVSSTPCSVLYAWCCPIL